MGKVISFKPRAESEASKQVLEYIEFSKQLVDGFYNEKLEKSLQWEQFNWTDWLKGANFAKHGINVRSKGFNPDEDLLDDKIIDFAKAYTLHHQSIKRTQNCDEIVAIRFIEKALLEIKNEADISKVDESVIELASEYMTEDLTAQRAYRMGGKLQSVAEFINSHKLTHKPLYWVNSIPRPRDARGHVELKEQTEEKMPDPKVFDALAEIWVSKPTDVRDIFVSSSCVILLSQPSRVGELNILSADCVMHKTTQSGEDELFLSWYGQKGFGHEETPIPKTFAPFCVEAINRIKEITEGPRQLAKFLEEHPDEFPMHDKCPRKGQDDILEPSEVLDALCIVGRPSVFRSWLLDASKVSSVKSKISKEYIQEALTAIDSTPKRFTMTLRKLNVILRDRYLPEFFPYTDRSKKMKFSQALNCFYLGQLGSSDSSGHGVVRKYGLTQISNSTLNDSLTMSDNAESRKRLMSLNIFRRWGFEGEEYAMTSHQFRRYLNTIADKGGVGEVERARWSKRLDLSQNATYNYTSTEERLEQSRELGLVEAADAPSVNLAEASRCKEPILLSDVGVSENRIAHYTLYGVCVHDFAMEPCTKYRDCITCKKHKCIKGDEEKLRRIKVIRDGAKESLTRALEGAQEEYFGADKWVQTMSDRYAKAANLVEILEDENIEEGAVIVCSDNGYSPLNKALSERGGTVNNNVQMLETDVAPAVEDMTALMDLLEM